MFQLFLFAVIFSVFSKQKPNKTQQSVANAQRKPTNNKVFLGCLDFLFSWRKPTKNTDRKTKKTSRTMQKNLVVLYCLVVFPYLFLVLSLFFVGFRALEQGTMCASRCSKSLQRGAAMAYNSPQTAFWTNQKDYFIDGGTQDTDFNKGKVGIMVTIFFRFVLFFLILLLGELKGLIHRGGGGTQTHEFCKGLTIRFFTKFLKSSIQDFVQGLGNYSLLRFFN